MQDVYEQVVRIEKDGREGVLVTVVDKQGHGPARVQTKMLVDSNGKRFGTVGGGALEFSAVKMVDEIFETRKPQLRTYKMNPENEIIDGENTGMICGGSITLFYEYIGSGEKLLIFGAGHIGAALVSHLRNLSYFVTLLDSREDVLAGGFDVGKTVCAPYEDFLETGDIPAQGYFVIATHSHEFDYRVLKKIYEHYGRLQPKYIGLVASKKKVEIIKKRLADELQKDVNFDSLFSPAGLSIGGTLPDEIAVSIIAELQAVRYGKKVDNNLRKN